VAADVVTAIAVLALASAALGATLEYLTHAIRFGKKKR
jgi:hypothetical protein